MKIIHLLLGKANPDRMNGVNKVVHQLVVAQHKLGLDVALWGLTKNTTAAVYQRPVPTRLFHDFGPWQPLAEQLIQATVALPAGTVFHLHGAYTRQIYMVARLLKRQAIPYMFTPHGAYNTLAMRKNHWLKLAYGCLFERRLVRGAGMVHLIGQSEVTATRRAFGRINTVLIPNGQALPGQQPLKPPSLKSVNCLNFGFLGRIDMHTKGLDLLLKGFAQFMSNVQVNSRLTIVGDGADLPALKKLAQHLNISQYVVFTGALYGQAKTDALQQVHVLVQPSRNEGLPGAPLEAAALGIPLLVSHESNLGNYVTVHRAGLCLPQNTVANIAKAMATLAIHWHNCELDSLGVNASQMVTKVFQWPAIAQRLTQQYKQLLA